MKIKETKHVYNQHDFDADLEFIGFKPGEPNMNTKQSSERQQSSFLFLIKSFLEESWQIGQMFVLTFRRVFVAENRRQFQHQFLI